MVKQEKEPRSALKGGLDYLAERAAIEQEISARGLGHTYVDDSGRFVGISPQDDWQKLGINAFVVQLVLNTRELEGGLVGWLSAAMSEHRFVTPSGRRVRLCPDSVIGLDFDDGVQQWFLLEYEEEQVDGAEIRAKLAGYRHYYESSEWTKQFPAQPTLLFVCEGNQVERQVFRALSRMSADIPAFATTERRYLVSQKIGPGTLGRIWRVPRSRGFHYAFKLPVELAE